MSIKDFRPTCILIKDMMFYDLIRPYINKDEFVSALKNKIYEIPYLHEWKIFLTHIIDNTYLNEKNKVIYDELATYIGLC